MFEVLVDRCHYTLVYAESLSAAMEKAAAVLGIVREDGMLTMPDGAPVAVLRVK